MSIETLRTTITLIYNDDDDNINILVKVSHFDCIK